MRKAFICPSKYVQGENELENLGYFVSTFGNSALLIAHPDDIKRVKDKLDYTCAKYGVKLVEGGIQGECSRQEAARLQALAREYNCACTIGLGGGKAIDTAKCVAEGNALIIVPTIVATDAPTSHSAVMYTREGGFDGYVHFKQSPSVVLVDTTVIANAPVRFLVSGMGDALSTYFEARAVANSRSSVNAGLPCGVGEGLCKESRGTKTALALARLCFETLLEDGVKAKLACEHNMVTPALENIVEANTLMSGLGFENGGLAAAHAIHNGLTLLEPTHHYLHGEKVAFSTLAQLVLENADSKEIAQVLKFCASVGLPVCLADLGVEEIMDEQLKAVAEKACTPEQSSHSLPFPIEANAIAAAIRVADRLGQEFKKGTYT